MTREEFIKEVRRLVEENFYTSNKEHLKPWYESLEISAGDIHDNLFDGLCETCIEELEICDGCGEAYCRNCDDGCGTDGGGNDLCSGCMKAVEEEWKRVTENGNKVCQTCSYYQNERSDCFGHFGDCAICGFDPRRNGHCNDWTAKTE